MSSEPKTPPGSGRSGQGEPAWDVALLFPAQGEWSEDEFLALDTRRLVELSEGRLEVLPAPTPFHQALVQFLFEMLKAFVSQHGLGLVFVAPLPVRLWAGKLREPDVIFLRPGRIVNPRRPPAGADLVIEVVNGSGDGRRRDLEIKRREYALAGIEEYWIVDPEERRVTVLALDGDVYRTHGEYVSGQRAASRSLAGFGIEVEDLFAQADALPGRE